MNCNTAAQDNTSSLTVPRSSSSTLLYSDLDILNIPSANYCGCTMKACKFCEATCAYIAGFIVRSVSKSLKCQECTESLYYSDQDRLDFMALINIHNRGGLVYPSRNVFELVKLSETFIRKNVHQISIGQKYLRQKLEISIIKSSGHLFSNLNKHDLDHFTDEILHSLLLRKLIIRKYIDLRMRKIGKDVSLKCTEKGKGNKLFRSVIFQNL